MGKYSFKSVIFDLDGVITQTARVHAQAWKIVFDEYLRLREKRDGEPFREFTHEGDYLPYVDGKPRYKGVESFLESRGIKISYGEVSDPPEKETICGIGNRKNLKFREALKKEGAEVYKTSLPLIETLKKAGIKVGVASSSKNCKYILESAGLEKLFATRVDGVVSAELGLKGKPEGDIFVTAARNLKTEPSESVVVEDATSGVQAGRNGAFGLVLGVARKNNEDELLNNGADIVVRDLADIDIDWIESWFQKSPCPLFESWEKRKDFDLEKRDKILINPCFSKPAKIAFQDSKKLVFFLDYDGTLTPIVKRPEEAIIHPQMREILEKLSSDYRVAIVSGRLRKEVEELVGIKNLFYAGSHGLDISGPGISSVHPQAEEIIPFMTQAASRLGKKLGKIPGILIEDKKFTVALHYRLAEESSLPRVKKAVETILKKHKELRLLSGKKVFEIMPNIDWDKGKAIRFIIDALGISWNKASVVFIGDDTTDEDAFRIIRTRGSGVLVSDIPRRSAADFSLKSVDEVKKIFEKIISS